MEGEDTTPHEVLHLTKIPYQLHTFHFTKFILLLQSYFCTYPPVTLAAILTDQILVPLLSTILSI